VKSGVRNESGEKKPEGFNKGWERQENGK
jgi:hypothetical protein